MASTKLSRLELNVSTIVSYSIQKRSHIATLIASNAIPPRYLSFSLSFVVTSVDGCFY